eukprot:TRINITY_DN32859_c0_g1_i1.p1 TRINITY_DN32859_c0_g1~~TRINITY_DN32859_c0_g1_i1.p1  ORF type:complete len:236 (-),score=103.97 TRINITY_DN32859_c0_g1_i1:46-753(-)
MQSDPLFQELAKRVKDEPDVVKKINTVFKWVVKGASGEKTWILDLKKGEIKEGTGSADCTITMTDADSVSLLTGKLEPQGAFMQGKLKLAGNMAAAMKLSGLLQGRSLAAGGATAKKTSGAGFKSDAVFAEMATRIKADPTIVKKINGVYQWNIKDASGKVKTWTVDLKNGAGSVTEGAGTKPDVTLAVSDDDYVKMVTGQLDTQQAFMQGKIKITGNMSFAMKLGQIMKPASKM